MKEILYYTDNQINMSLAKTCRKYIEKSGLPITSATLKPTKFGNNVHVPLERGYETMFTQILAGLEATKEEIIYFCEHDVLYHQDHFDFTPPEKDKFYYNGNYWFLRLTDGFAIHYNVSPLSGLVAYRESLLKHFWERYDLLREEGFSRTIGFEPMTHHRIKWKNWYDFEVFMPKNPNIDVTHGENATWKRWKKSQFRREPKFWEESTIDKIPGWPDLPKILKFEKPKISFIPNTKRDISIVIPSRNEEFLKRTIDDILEHSEANTDIFVGLDGKWAEPRIPDNPRVTILHYSESIGQRAITNQLVRLSQAKYIIKCDAHCSFDQGFDRKMLEAFKKTGDNVTMVPIMRNLHAFDWICKNGHTRYQGPSGPCTECGEETTKDIKWIGKNTPQSTSYRFDKTLHFQYFNEFKKRPEGKGELTESMSLQGSFFMLTRDKYWELDICDEKHGSWGQQGTEVACKTWLSGGRVICNQNTWYAHMFRTQGGDFGFPYPISGGQVEEARKYSRMLFKDGGWDKAKHNLQWLIDRFKPVPDWD